MMTVDKRGNTIWQKSRTISVSQWPEKGRGCSLIADYSLQRRFERRRERCCACRVKYEVAYGFEEKKVREMYQKLTELHDVPKRRIEKRLRRRSSLCADF